MNHITESGVAASATRRAFAGRVLACAGTIMILPLREALAAPARVEESDENAVALGYKHDTKKVDAKKYPKHAATQHCANCGLWQGAAADPWAGCAMFGRKQIAAEGWCSAWVAKPAG